MSLSKLGGKRVVFAPPEEGLEVDKEKADRHLVVGGIYTIDQVHVDGNLTFFSFMECPRQQFNSALFDEYEDPKQDRTSKFRNFLAATSKKKVQHVAHTDGHGEIWIIGAFGAEQIYDIIGGSIVKLKLMISEINPAMPGLTKNLKGITAELEEARDLIYRHYCLKEDPTDESEA